MLFSAVLIVVIILSYFIALLLAERMERLAFEALSYENKLIVTEVRSDRDNGLALLVLIVPIYLAIYINRFDFADFKDMFGFSEVRFSTILFALTIAVVASLLGRRLGKRRKERPKMKIASQRLPQTFRKAKRMANIVRVVSSATLTLYFVIAF